MATHNHNTEKRAGQNRPASCRTRPRKLSRIGNIAGGVLVSGLLVISCGSSKFINNNQSNIAAYGDTMGEKYYKPPEKEAYGKAIIKGKKAVEKWNQEMMVIYSEQADLLKMEEEIRGIMKPESSSLAEDFTNFLKDLDKDQKKFFLTLVSTMIDDPKRLAIFVKVAMGTVARLKVGEKISLDLEEDLKKGIQGGIKTAEAYNKLVTEIGIDDEFSQHLLQVYLTVEQKAGRLEPALLYLKKYYVDKPIDKEVLDKVAKTAPSVLKSIESFLEKSQLEMFNELMNKKFGLMNKRERILFLNIVSRLADVQDKYARAFVVGVYGATQSKDIHGVYISEMERLKDIWGTEIQESFESLFKKAKPGIKPTDLEKIMLVTQYHYAFLEAFQVNPPSKQSFFSQLLKRSTDAGIATTTYAQKGAIEGQKYYAMGAALGGMGTSTGLSFESWETSLLYASTLLFSPLVYGASAGITEALNFSAQSFVNWIVSIIDPDEKKQVIKWTFNTMSGAKPPVIMNDPYSVMEFGAAIAILGDKYKDIRVRENIDTALKNIERGVTKGIVKWHDKPIMVVELHRILNICVTATSQQPGRKWYGLFDVVLGETLHAIEKEKIKTKEDMVDFVNTLEYIAKYRNYKLGKVAEAIWKAVDKKHPLSEILKNAVDLTTEYKKINKKSLRNPKKAKPIFGLKTVPKKGGYYAKKAVPKKKGGKA